MQIKSMKGCHEQMLPSYLDEFMWRERHGRTASNALNSIIRDIAVQYRLSMPIPVLLTLSAFHCTSTYSKHRFLSRGLLITL